MGLRHTLVGNIRLAGRDLRGQSTKDILRAGVGYVPEDRSVDGLVRDFSIAENLVLDRYGRPPFGNAFALDLAAIGTSANERITQFDIRTSGADAPASSLSGGNQQKVIVAREMSRPLKLFVASQPTRGVDVGSIEFIHSQIMHERGIGTAVLLISSELDEVMAVSDRIAVMYRGRIIATVSPETPREEIGLLMAGVHGSDGGQSQGGRTDGEGQ
jgi:general nucleoside transport system ATP-binding protein